MKLTREQQKLVTDNQGFAYHLTQQFIRRNPRYEGIREDLTQVALMAMCRAALDYDASHQAGAKFATFSALGIKSRLLEAALKSRSSLSTSFRKKDGTREAAPEVSEVSFDSDALDPAWLPAAPTIDTDPMEDTARLFSEMEDDMVTRRTAAKFNRKDPVLARRDAKIFIEVAFHGRLTRDAAQEIGTTSQAVSVICKKARRYFDEWAKNIREESNG